MAQELIGRKISRFQVAQFPRALASRVMPAFRPASDAPLWPARTWRRWSFYGESLILVALITAVGLHTKGRLAPASIALVYLLAVVISAARWGRGPGMFSALAGALAFDFLLIPVYGGFSDTGYAVSFFGLLVVGVVISTLAGESREESEQAYGNRAHTAAMYSFSQALASASRLDEIVEVLGHHVSETFHRPVVVALPDQTGLTARFRSPEYAFTAEERAAAAWAFEHGQSAGRGTEILPSVEGYYLPLKTAWDVRGVLGLRMIHEPQTSAKRQYPLLESFASRAALAIGRAVAEEKAREAELLEQTDRLQKALLNSISHNLRTPLATVTGALRSLIEDRAVLDEETRMELLANAEEQAVRLDRLVGNLLDMTRLEAGAVRVKRETCDVQDIVGAALEQLGEASRRREIQVDLPAEQLLVPLDFVLVTQVLVNLIDNALKYSPRNCPVEIHVRRADDSLEVAVCDHGVGIPQQDLGRIFERFQRGSRSGQTGGTGLGLSICKGFVEVHGGRIWAERRGEGGSRVVFTIPMSPLQQISNIDHEPAGTQNIGN
jgi:two-component system sensor histidine kinase KdpD